MNNIDMIKLLIEKWSRYKMLRIGLEWVQKDYAQKTRVKNRGRLNFLG